MEGAPCGDSRYGIFFSSGSTLTALYWCWRPFVGHFEPTGSVDMRFISYKTALLLALACVKEVGDLILNFHLYGTKSPSWLICTPLMHTVLFWGSQGCIAPKWHIFTKRLFLQLVPLCNLSFWGGILWVWCVCATYLYWLRSGCVLMWPVALCFAIQLEVELCLNKGSPTC